MAYQILNLFSNKKIYDDFINKKCSQKKTIKKRQIRTESKNITNILSKQMEM